MKHCATVSVSPLRLDCVLRTSCINCFDFADIGSA